MEENENLFERLSMMFKIGGEETKELINAGYITPDLFTTKKTEDFKRTFIETYKDKTLHALRETSDTREAMKRVGLTRFIAFLVMCDELAYEGYLEKTEEGKYKVK
ncbi:hypothetical protein Psfp_03324 [Pelotomaculum sp. FP]|uniref:hypothetical protein n=1 Tax=Pelotomaculum sp. FP TaxID=261474 RepID=UPI001066C685|nr:hypothetical protein [Pelotomaculum sp. FP]TEB13908.1 hypothetical protein Psfp_03324 [Pelotomaculum sp. FP]